jgi:hydantoinase/carbamoylase family amidase
MLDNGDSIESHFKAIGKHGCDSKGGWTRLAYTSSEDSAYEYAISAFLANGFTVKEDAFQNLIASKGQSTRRVMVGTHLDTVRQGGNFDGVTGFAAGIEAIKDLPDNLGIDFVVFRAEESVRFNKACIGSGAATGTLSKDEAIDKKCTLTGRTLYQVIEDHGGKPEYFGKPWINPADYQAYFEIHIEQASVLESSRKSVGIVTSIRAPVRYEIQLSGPGAGYATALMITSVETLGNEAFMAGNDIVTTVGKVDGPFKVEPNNPNTIAGKASIVTNVDMTKEFEEVQNLGKVTYYSNHTDEGFQFTIIGEQNHSGGTPMNKRKDALAALADAICRHKNDNPHFRMGNYSNFVTDIRSNDEKTRSATALSALTYFSQVADNMGVKIKISKTEESIPAPSLDMKLQSMLKSSADELGIDYMFLPSGAGHDALKIYQIGIPTAMLFVPSLNGRSHCSEEFTEIKHILNAKYVLERTLLHLN